MTNPSSVVRVLDAYHPNLVVHDATYTGVAAAETLRCNYWPVNFEAMRQLMRALSEHKINPVHISTDYVFYGSRGMYRKSVDVGAVRNNDALSMLVEGRPRAWRSAPSPFG